MRNDYSKLDLAILEAIKQGKKQFNSIHTDNKVSIEADKFVRDSFKLGWRFVDARLQALRKRMALEYLGQKDGWRIK